MDGGGGGHAASNDDDREQKFRRRRAGSFNNDIGGNRDDIRMMGDGAIVGEIVKRRAPRRCGRTSVVDEIKCSSVRWMVAAEDELNYWWL